MFAPLGMTSTSYRYADFERRENRAAPHYRTPEGVWELGDLTDDDAAAPAGGVSSNLRDLTQWLRLHLAGGMFDGQQVVASDPLRETHRPQIVAFSPPDPAAGPRRSTDWGGPSPTTTGAGWKSATAAISTATAPRPPCCPGSGLGILVLCNGGASAVRGAIPKAFLEMVTQGEPSQDWVSAIETSFAAALASILATSTPFPQGEPPADAAPPLPLDAYTGAYSNTIYGEVTVRDEAGALVLKFGPNGVQHRLNPWDRDAFSYRLTGSEGAQLAQFGVLFTVGPEGQAVAAQISLGGVGPDAVATFTRLVPDA